MSIRILICDDQALVRAGFRKLLESEPEIEVVGEAEDGLQAVELVRRRSPDLVLMDIRMPRLDGIEATRRIVAEPGPSVRVLMLTTFGNDQYVYESLRAGASAFLLKDAPPEDLLAAVQIVARGDSLLAPAVTRAVVEAFVRSSPARPELTARLESLTPRELEVLELLARRQLQQRDRECPDDQRSDRKDPRRPRPDEARRARPRTRRHLRLRKRHRHHEHAVRTKRHENTLTCSHRRTSPPTAARLYTPRSRWYTGAGASVYNAQADRSGRATGVPGPRWPPTSPLPEASRVCRRTRSREGAWRRPLGSACAASVLVCLIAGR